MTLSQLNYFVTVAKNGHLTQTAKELLIAQPSLSQAIHKLEDELGFALFEKRGRTLILTKEGNDFYPYALKVVRSVQNAEHSAHNIYRRHMENIRFAYTRPLPESYVPKLIQSFFENHQNQNVNIETYSAPTADILEALKKDKIDFGFCSESGADPEAFKIIPLLEYPIQLAAGEKDPLCRLRQVHPKDLLGRPGISYTEGSSMDRKISGFFEKYEIQPDIRYRTSSEEIQKFIASGLGWALIAQSDAPCAEGVQILEMPEMDLKRNTFFVMKKDREPGKAARRFLNFVLEYNGRYQT